MRGTMCACGRPQCVSPGKHPANQKGLTEATTDESQIRAWWAEMPDASIGVVMEPSGLVAFDLDDYHGDLEKLAALEQTLGPLPATVTQISGSKQGFHAIFQSPGFPVRGVIGGIVVRSKAYIIVAPSNHKSGGNYEWHPGSSPTDIAVATLPDSWKNALKKEAEVGQVGIPAEEPAWLAQISSGQRIALMKAHFAKESGEVKGTSLAGTTFNIVRSAIRLYAVRDSEAALEAAIEFDAKCVPPWGARMGRHVWTAYQRAHTPEWGAGLRGFASEIVPSDVEIDAELLAAARFRGSDAKKLSDKQAIQNVIEKDRKEVDKSLAFTAEALVRRAPRGTSDDKLAGLLIACLLPRDDAYRAIWQARAKVWIETSGPASAGLVDLPVNGAPAEPGTPVPAAFSEAEDWKMAILGTLELDSEGEGVKSTPHNIYKVLTGDPIFGKNVRFNELFKQIEMLTEPFASTAPNSLSQKVQIYLDAFWQMKGVTRADIESQLAMIARDNPFNPIAEYLRSLTWDGVERLTTWLVEYCGAEDTEFNRRAGTMWLIAACARGVCPGSKVDNVLVLEGPQGIKKSTCFAVLAGPWFSDTPLAIGNKDSYMVSGSRWIIELAELASLRASETEAQKAFLTAKVDSYRPPYGKVLEEFKRFAVFAATTNDDEYLPDPTGNRRYLPVRVTRCDAIRLQQDRDQIWAEAYHRYMSADLAPELAHSQAPGERWWFETEEEQDMAAKVVSKRRPENLWTGLIREWTKRGNILGQNSTRRQWTLAEIAKNALDIEIEKMPSKQKALTIAVKEAGLTPVVGSEGQPMWKAPDLQTDEPEQVSVTTGLPNSN
jgi:hypothetical protein